MATPEPGQTITPSPDPLAAGTGPPKRDEFDELVARVTANDARIAALETAVAEAIEDARAERQATYDRMETLVRSYVEQIAAERKADMDRIPPGELLPP